MAQPNSLERFIEAQAPVYATALAEITAGAKRSHWMWFIFPQLRGLGQSETARFYGIQSAAEASAYHDHPVLGTRYRECVAALPGTRPCDPRAVFGDVDAMKLRSSLTLFEAVQPSADFAEALETWFAGERDPATLRLLAEATPL